MFITSIIYLNKNYKTEHITFIYFRGSYLKIMQLVLTYSIERFYILIVL